MTLRERGVVSTQAMDLPGPWCSGGVGRGASHLQRGFQPPGHRRDAAGLAPAGPADPRGGRQFPGRHRGRGGQARWALRRGQDDRRAQARQTGPRARLRRRHDPCDGGGRRIRGADGERPVARARVRAADARDPLLQREPTSWSAPVMSPEPAWRTNGPGTGRPCPPSPTPTSGRFSGSASVTLPRVQALAQSAWEPSTSPASAATATASRSRRTTGQSSRAEGRRGAHFIRRTNEGVSNMSPRAA